MRVDLAFLLTVAASPLSATDDRHAPRRLSVLPILGSTVSRPTLTRLSVARGAGRLQGVAHRRRRQRPPPPPQGWVPTWALLLHRRRDWRRLTDRPPPSSKTPSAH